MIHNCKQILKNLRKLSSTTDTGLTFLGCTNQIALQNDYDTFYDYSKYKGEIHALISQLAKDGYIDYKNDSDFKLTALGMHPYQFQWETFKSFLIRSFLVPIIVSVITTLLTLLVESLL